MKVKTELTRRELYLKVWKKPMVRLAKEFGVSDVSLAKICKKYNIPRPKRGYWIKLQHGKKVNIVQLPGDRLMDKELIVIDPHANNCKRQKGRHASAVLKNKVSVPKRLRQKDRLHPEIAKALRKGLSDCDENGLGKFDNSRLDIMVSPKNEKRALCILDTIIKAMEKRGYKLKVAKQGNIRRLHCKSVGRDCFFEIKGEKIFFSLREKLNQIKHKLTPEEQCKKELYGEDWYRKYDYIPSGRLKFLLVGNWGTCFEKIETRTKPLEDSLPAILKAILKTADSFKKCRIARKRREREWAKKRREEQNKVKDQEKADDLMKLVNGWHKAREIRQFLNETENFIIERNGGYAKGSEFDEWLKWSRQYANRIDPLK